MFYGLGNKNDVDHDIKEIQEDLARIVSRARTDIQEAANSAATVAKKKIDEVSGTMREKSQQVDAYAREHTWTAIAIAALVGWLLGVLLSRNRRD